MAVLRLLRNYSIKGLQTSRLPCLASGLIQVHHPTQQLAMPPGRELRLPLLLPVIELLHLLKLYIHN